MFGKTKNTIFTAPLTGKLVDITEVPDEVFSKKLMGDGIAITPTQNTLTAPIDAEVTLIFDTLHAIGIKTKNGIEILIHIGLDTVNLKGEHFKSNIKKGDKVKQNDTLITFNAKAIQEAGYNLITPIIIIESDKYPEINKNTQKTVTQNIDKIFTITP